MFKSLFIALLLGTPFVGCSVQLDWGNPSTNHIPIRWNAWTNGNALRYTLFWIPSYVSNIVVSGGTAGDGTYSPAGTTNGKAFYTTGSQIVYWQTNPASWVIDYPSLFPRGYAGYGDVPLPNLATNWTHLGDDLGTPAVTATYTNNWQSTNWQSFIDVNSSTTNGFIGTNVAFTSWITYVITVPGGLKTIPITPKQFTNWSGITITNQPTSP